LAALAVLAVPKAAWAQGAVRDQSGTLTTAGAADQKKSWLEQRFAGSTAEITTYIGTGSFYTSGYRDPYVSNAFFLRPQYNLGTKYKLSVAGRIYFEQEYTTSDLPNGRSFNPYDSILYFNAKNLYTMPRAKVTFFGGLRATIPVSYESRYAHLVTAFGISGGATRTFEFGRPDSQGKRWNLTLTWGEGFSKAVRTSDLRGNSPGDTTGCRITGPNGYTGGPGASDSDRCGGPLNTSFGITSTGAVAVSRGRYSVSASLIVINEFKYAIDDSTYNLIVANANAMQASQMPSSQNYSLATQGQVARGRADITWGMLTAGYDINDHLSLSVGLASYQPAMSSDYKSLRFPFFDFAGANSNNFTQVLVGVAGTL
jgi:hypothetical protein